MNMAEVLAASAAVINEIFEDKLAAFEIDMRDAFGPGGGLDAEIERQRTEMAIERRKSWRA
jgi:hypothetical protein